MGGAVAVQVPELTPAELEGELTAPPRARLDSRPGCDFLGYLLAGRHLTQPTSSSELEVKAAV